MDPKDYINYGLPTLLLVILFLKVPSWVQTIGSFFKDISDDFVAAIKEGFAKLDTAQKESSAAWQARVTAMHADNRADIAKQWETIAKHTEAIHAALPVLKANHEHTHGH